MILAMIFNASERQMLKTLDPMPLRIRVTAHRWRLL